MRVSQPAATPTSSTPPDAIQELHIQRYVSAALDEVLVNSSKVQRNAVEIQQRVLAVHDRLEKEQAIAQDRSSSPLWRNETAATPSEVAKIHKKVADGSRTWWVVYVGREPGLYTTSDAQIKGCPNQQYRRKASKKEALNFYKEKYEAGEVEKWVEVY
ncbi:hypothetical protein R3P38DRAFT_2794723 [Favolaschia claudopus]|uniref:Uncharacterized protein n=1 Tax=Favolaschia claudopus TaxID=2862362 RepID=A0AAW0A9W7_9AGAR